MNPSRAACHALFSVTILSALLSAFGAWAIFDARNSAKIAHLNSQLAEANYQTKLAWSTLYKHCHEKLSTNEPHTCCSKVAGATPSNDLPADHNLTNPDTGEDLSEAPTSLDRREPRKAVTKGMPEVVLGRG